MFCTLKGRRKKATTASLHLIMNHDVVWISTSLWSSLCILDSHFSYCFLSPDTWWAGSCCRRNKGNIACTSKRRRNLSTSWGNEGIYCLRASHVSLIRLRRKRIKNELDTKKSVQSPFQLRILHGKTTSGVVLTLDVSRRPRKSQESEEIGDRGRSHESEEIVIHL